MLSFADVELEARKLLASIEKSAGSIWPNTRPSRLQMCDPAAACWVLGLSYLPDSHLGTFGGTATAGILDRANRAVLISSSQSVEALRFTAAHEVGHWLLHPGQIMFRDRALTAPGGVGRPPEEQEADRFAGCFLVPPKLLIAAFREMFSVREPITNTGAVCWNLGMGGSYLEGLPAGSREFALAVARAETFNGRHFRSLAKLFNVSPTAMAIRLQELELVS